MNILFISTEIPYPPDSGHRLRTFHVLKYLGERHNVFFLGFNRNGTNFCDTAPIEAYCASVETFSISEDVSKLRFYYSLLLNLCSPLPFVAHKYYRKELRRSIQRIISDKKIDIVHFDMLPLARYLNDIGDVPSVLVQHNVESQRVYRLAQNSKSLIFKLFMLEQFRKLYKFEKNVLDKFAICTAVSDVDATHFRRMNSQARIYVIPNGVDTKFFTCENFSTLGNSLIWVGSMRDLYNREAVDYFCTEIFPRIREVVPDVSFNAVGRSPTKVLVELSKSDTNVSVLGYVDDIRPHVKKAAVYVAPMRSGGGTKLKILNALSMGKAVVTTSVGAEGIDINHREHVMIADDPETFTTMTIDLLRNPELRKELGKNGRKWMVERYDWEKICSNMEHAYNEIRSLTGV
jgi:sugar transferase (PEP-CTERM/EpsH1 system associated)